MSVDHNRRLRARDAAIRRTRMIIAGVAASAIALSGLFAGVAAQAFKGHQPTTAAIPTGDAAAPAQPATGDDPDPLQPPSQPPSAAPPQDSAPQVSGGS